MQPAYRYFPPPPQKMILEQRFSSASLCHTHPQCHPHISNSVIYNKALLLSNHCVISCKCGQLFNNLLTAFSLGLLIDVAAKSVLTLPSRMSQKLLHC